MVLYRRLLPFSVVGAIISIVAPFIGSLLNGDIKVPESLIPRTLMTLATIVGSWLLLELLLYLKYVSTLRHPGPIPLPILGNSLSFVQNGNLQTTMKSLISTYGDIVDILFFHGERRVIIHNADACKIVCKSTDRGDLPEKSLDDANWRERFLWQELFGLYGIDLFSRTDNIMNWTAHRKFLHKAFDQKNVRGMASQIESAIDTMITTLPVRETFDVLPHFENFGVDMIHRTTLGGSSKKLKDGGRFLPDCLNRMTNYFNECTMNPFLYLTVKVLPHLGLNPREFQRQKDIHAVRQYIRGLIAEEQARNRNHDESPNLVRLLVDGMNDEFAVENVVDDIGSFIFAGYDTSTATLGNLMHHLAAHPQIQEKLAREVKTGLSDGGDSSNLAERVKEMPFLAACIRESQRLQPVASVLQRRTQVDIMIPGGKADPKVTIPAGTVVFIPTHLLQRDETQYPEPESFRPERWLDDDSKRLKAPKPGYFYAFGLGPKMCIGMQLAESNIKMAAAAIVRNFKIESRGDVEIVDQFTTQPKQVLLELSRRGS